VKLDYVYPCIPPYGYQMIPEPPHQVGTDTDWTAFGGCNGNVCGIRAGGDLYCWGANDRSQVGDGTHIAVPAPMHIAPGTKWATVSPSWQWTCGIQQDGSLWCWGDGRFGELGLGFAGNRRPFPTRVGTFNDWRSVSLSMSATPFTCGIRAGGELWCWGDNAMGGVTRTRTATTTPQVVADGVPGGPKFCPTPRDNDIDGYSDCYGDCDDKNVDVNPSAPELCNGIDDDCDGAVDEGCP
jgi:hypothetical protein